MKKILLLVLAMLPMITQAQFSYDLQGHRGARGLMPENTIPGMIKALDLGVTTLELDLAVTKDGEVIISHEPYMNPLICLTPEGKEIPEGDRSHNIYQMTFEEVKQYDSGSKYHSGFPQQVKFHVTKPRLKDLFEVVEKYVTDHNLPKPNYNIEIKSSPEGDGVYHPSPAEFSDMVYKLIDSSISWDRVNIQSFDFRVLKYYNQKYPEVTLAMLITDSRKSQEQLKELGFQPEIYSPYFVALTKDVVSDLKGKGMKVIPWTVNTTEQMQNLLDMGVDGIITDFPNLAPKK
ncbi:glycerophosphodiester phosphodiesterase [Belliella aquatica]|uniref:Glycerophosphoryl diester phosphodiesterase n=1 Tax=Belliella aquatica TaxID=1323734 RepID=A0ABQ1MTP6_9BACT|nr:glycerophosphodiester phosphodiesterase [Belliella aquatica]MCH7406504.1 glycerophosphodiester phosphodiesterase [Belliella aquatica]GGC46538.1 glycerophosphoryl diester phosphodiesterase [Belliella aquatica]